MGIRLSSDSDRGGIADLTPPSTVRRAERVEDSVAAVPHRHRLLVVAANQVLPELLVPLMQGPGMRDFHIEVQADAQIATQWLAARRFDAYLFEESSLALLAPMAERERREIERRSVVVTLLESAHSAALTCSSCLPLARLTTRSLEHALWQAVRRNSSRLESVAAPEARAYETLLRLARAKPRETPALGLALQPLTEAAAEALGVGRTSVWVLREQPKRLVCLDLFDDATGTHRDGIEVPAAACPRYCLALRDHRILPIDDALRDGRSAELVDIYLRDAGIGALLDAPIYLDGEVVGLICHAHLGGPRRWTEAEAALAASFADYAQLALLADKRQRAEQALAAREHELARAQKMEALGRLAGGVAHDFNNLLTVISGNAQLLARTQPEGETARKLDAVVTACARSRDLVRQLLSFASPAAEAMAWVNIDAVIGEVCGMIANSLAPGIELRRRLDAGNAVVYGDASAIQSALLNLALNARDAMPGGGTLTFATRRAREADGGRAMLEIAVSDSGTGMTDEVRQRVLEPFFTTKPAGQGTGLGLANVYACAKAHGGALDFETELGRGTVFRLALPLDEAHTPRGTPIVLAGATAQPRPARILVVDDDEAVRRTVADLLGFLGHAVRSCADGFAALEALSADRDGIDLVVMDVVMPRMGGRDCLRAMRLVNPHLRCVLMSGTVPKAALSESAAAGVVGIIAKPFSLAEVAQVVAEALAVAAR